jgi:hypothetical protein
VRRDALLVIGSNRPDDRAIHEVLEDALYSQTDWLDAHKYFQKEKLAREKQEKLDCKSASRETLEKLRDEQQKLIDELARRYEEEFGRD